MYGLPPELAEGAAASGNTGRFVFDLYPLGDLASLMLRLAEAADRATPPLGAVHLGEHGGGAVFLETRLGRDGGEL